MTQVPFGTCVPELNPIPNLVPRFNSKVGIPTASYRLDGEKPRRKDRIPQSYARGTPVLGSKNPISYDVVQTSVGPIHIQKDAPVENRLPVDFLTPVYDSRLQAPPLRYYSR